MRLNTPISFALLLALTVLGCGDSGGGSLGDETPATLDVIDDTSSTPDVEGSSPDDASDVAADPGPDVLACPEVADPWPIDAAQTKFAMSLFHYNVQYVIGGLEYFDDDGISYTVGFDAEGWDNDKVEDWIVVETFEPILDLYAKHPTWRVDIELQGYMIDVMAKRHPTVLEKLAELVRSGQVELISFHYAAQLFLAFPREDMERSLARTYEVMDAHCLPLSGVVFNQEGQAGMGRQRMLVDEGYEVGVFPKNLFKYQHIDTPWWPYYASEGGTLIVGPGQVDPESGIDVAWDFFDDGELRAVEGFVNPYLAPIGGANEERLAEFEQMLMDREAAGYVLTTIGDYVRHLEAQGVEKKPAPPLLDGTWQPTSTTSIHRWLGGQSDVWQEDEEDNKVRAGNAVARMHVSATQVLLERAHAEGVDVADAVDRMATAWDRTFDAEVSDCSGVNPFRGEVLFGLNTNAWLLEETTSLRTLLLDALGWEHVTVDLETRSATQTPGPYVAGPREPAEPPLELAIESPGRTAEVAWYEIDADRWRVEIGFSAASAEGCEACELRFLRASFPRTEDMIRYSPGLIEDEVLEHPFDAFAFETGEVWLPLANGLIGLGDGWWAIKHVRQVHVTARVAPADPTIEFIDRNIWKDDTVTWAFEVVQGSAAEALAIANGLNTWPVVHY